MAVILRSGFDAAVRMAYGLPLGVQIPLIVDRLGILGFRVTERFVGDLLAQVPSATRPEQLWVDLLWGRFKAVSGQVPAEVRDEPGVLPSLHLLAERFYNFHDRTDDEAMGEYYKAAGWEVRSGEHYRALSEGQRLAFEYGSEDEAFYYADTLTRIVKARQLLEHSLEMPIDPQAMASRWRSRLQGEWEFIRSRVQQVQENPADKARSARDRWVAKMTDPATHNRWDNSLAGVTLAEWKASFKPELGAAFSASVVAAEGKVRSFAAWLSPTLDEIRAEVDATNPPGVTIDQQAERARAWVLAWRNRRYKGA